MPSPLISPESHAVVRIPLACLGMLAAVLACDLPGSDAGGASSGIQSVATSPPEVIELDQPTCQDLMNASKIAEDAQPQRGIFVNYPTYGYTQDIQFIAPDMFSMRTETPDVWEEIVSIEGSVFGRASVAPDWASLPFLDPTADAVMQQFTSPPAAVSLSLPGITGLKVTREKIVSDGSDYWVCEITYGTGARERTWFLIPEGLRAQFIREEGARVVEERIFKYTGIRITAP